jgi:hypothetical protein
MDGTFDIEWDCPNCGKPTTVFVEAESPSDYYSDNLCEHCSHEINDSKLELKITNEVNDYFVGKADYYKDLK